MHMKVYFLEVWHIIIIIKGEGHAVAQCLRHYATNRKVAVSIPDEVIF
jgi:hypothetical protein